MRRKKPPIIQEWNYEISLHFKQKFSYIYFKEYLKLNFINDIFWM